MPSRVLTKGKNTLGNTNTQAIPNTKKSKCSDARPITTPIAISPGATVECFSEVCFSMAEEPLVILGLVELAMAKLSSEFIKEARVLLS
jgi:hypothetical protein